MSPYRRLEGDEADQPWVGPFIYDGQGELVWSGGAMFSLNVDDFRISNVNGENLMTLMTDSKIYLLENDYSIRSASFLTKQQHQDTHELNFVDGGRRALLLEFGLQKSSEKESKVVGYDGRCIAQYTGFFEVDVTKDGWPRVYEWSSRGKIGLDESTMTQGSLDDRCGEIWDFL